MAKNLVEKKDDWAKTIGMPDAWDKKNIQALVTTFSKTTFTIPVGDEKDSPTIEMTGSQWIKQGLAEARERHQVTGSLKGNEFGVKSKAIDMRVICSVPKPLQSKLSQGYPTLFKDQHQLMWFARNFPMFRIPTRL